MQGGSPHPAPIDTGVILRTSIVRHGFFFVIVALVTLLFLGLIREFIQPLFWAAVLAVLFNRLQRKCLQLLHGRSSSAAALSLLLIVIIVILPLFFIAAAVTREGIWLYDTVTENSDFQKASQYLEHTIPELDHYLGKFGFNLQKIQQRLSDLALTVGRFLGSQIVSVGQGTAVFLLKFFLMIYILFFFLRDGDRFLDAFSRALPFEEARKRRLFSKFAEVSRATLKGSMIMAGLQGSIGGFLFWILGINVPVFWGVIMAILALLPALGSILVWGPAGIILILTNHPVKGIILLLAESIATGVIDNILRPIIVGRDTRMPDFLILLSTLGGLTVFGISGFVIGPIIMALFLTIWDMFAREYSEEMKENNT